MATADGHWTLASGCFGAGRHVHFCPACRHVFLRRSHLLLHQRSGSDCCGGGGGRVEAPLDSPPQLSYCEYCSAGFLTLPELLAHRFAEHESKHVWCPTCGILFSSRNMYQQHIEHHGEAEADMATQPPGSFDEVIADSYEGHRHFVRNLPVCRYCEITCASSEILQGHLDAVHSGDVVHWLAPLHRADCVDAWLRFLQSHSAASACASASVACGLCGDRIRLGSDGSPEPLYLHLLRNHQSDGAGGRPYLCVVCPVASHSQAAATSHYWICHAHRRRTRCPRCCRLVPNAQRHVCRRLPAARHMCPGCGREFASLGALRQHRLPTNSAAPTADCRGPAPARRILACEHCGHRFQFRANLLRHRRIHAGRLPFRCPHCGDRFSDVTNLYRHAAYCHPCKRLLACPLCQQFACDRALDMRSHLATAHAGRVNQMDLRRVLRFVGVAVPQGDGDETAAAAAAAGRSGDGVISEGGLVAPVRERRAGGGGGRRPRRHASPPPLPPLPPLLPPLLLPSPSIPAAAASPAPCSIVQIGCALAVVPTEPAASPRGVAGGAPATTWLSPEDLLML